jgi:hypothetical protein
MEKELTVRQFASLGGFASARKLSPEQRSQRSRHAVMARWCKYRQEKARREQAINVGGRSVSSGPQKS